MLGPSYLGLFSTCRLKWGPAQNSKFSFEGSTAFFRCFSGLSLGQSYPDMTMGVSGTDDEMGCHSCRSGSEVGMCWRFSVTLAAG